ncbi:hypothetical protein, partial [Klebsiella pneumoniae]|uniref:hypothetical protein n=1 Tax=Klebsiella pneumoniae TaxID=573 RepID=UPI003AF9C301
PDVSDEERAKAVIKLGKAMDEAWHGCRPAKLARIPEKPVMEEFLQEQEVQSALGQVAKLPIGYKKKNASVCTMELREWYSGLVCGARK